MLREIDRRVRYLRRRLEDVRVVEYSSEQEGKVFFGACWRSKTRPAISKNSEVVGYDEIFDHNDYISIDSPMAHAFLRTEVGDEAVLQAPNGEMLWWMNEILHCK
ncbi:GreA/GreB family elongation factor [Pseudomonas sp. P4795]|uniref:GreA/GreB family elongation factor n=1 Tax=Pseudomonas sp. P4795 TaxID=3409915 RepID=UPI003B5C5BB6